MAMPRVNGSSNNLDMEQIFFEAQHRWLRTPEICEILQNYKKFNIAPEPPYLPPSGSIFLFDRKVLRYFRKDGHSWRKKKDGKTIKEAHEKLKAGSVDVLHCYYAHGEENENFQRRSYWMLEKELTHIVLVHYREVEGFKTNFIRFKEAEEAVVSGPDINQNICGSEMDNSMNISSLQNCCQMLSQNTDSRSPDSAHASEYENAEIGNCQAVSSAPSLDIDEDRSFQKQKELDLWGWKDALESHDARILSASVKVKPSIINREPNSVDNADKRDTMLVQHHSKGLLYANQTSETCAQGPEQLQVSMEDGDVYLGPTCELKDTTNIELHDYFETDRMLIDGQNVHTVDFGIQMQLSHALCKEHKSDTTHTKSENYITIENSSLSTASMSLDRSCKGKGLKKNDSFGRWMSKELGDVESVTLSSSGAYWDAVDNGSDCPTLSPRSMLDCYTLCPSLSQEQLFRIIDFSPNWAYTGCETKVLVTGEFLKTRENKLNIQWSCMFGEVEVPAEVIGEGVLRCYTPLHDVARVPFYITCSNRIACSEVREFEYRARSVPGVDTTSTRHRCETLKVRFVKLLSQNSDYSLNDLPTNLDYKSHVRHKITSLLQGDNEDWNQLLKVTSGDEYCVIEVNKMVTEKLLKGKLCELLLSKVVEGGKYVHILDEDGQGVLHFAAALGYEWAISPTVIAGVNINFRDLRGWTALHWAAFYGRECMVVYLISLGETSGALTDPTPTHPLGRTPADLASENGHKGISGFLAESALNAHLECLTLKDRSKSCNNTHVQTTSDRSATPASNGDHLDGLSLKDSLAALCNATQAAARIHQVYRVLSFKRKQIENLDDVKAGKVEIDALSLITMKTHKQCQRVEPVHAAAVRIQNKFRSWKSRRQFLTFRQQIVRIQAHVRGHQVRKSYIKFVWSVGIVEKIILRWRRKRSGLRGFKPESSVVEPFPESSSLKEDDYDFLKEGRKQAEQRMEKALSRVKSMVRHPEAREQYRRLLTTVTEIKENKDNAAIDGSSGMPSLDDDLIDLDLLLNKGSISAGCCSKEIV